MPRDSRLCRLAALALSVLLPGLQSSVVANTTNWTGVAGNLLWADPANWSDGVPTADSAAVIPSIAAATIDLGGLARPVDSLSMTSTTTLANGTLVANQISTNHTNTGLPPDIAATLTTAGPTLRLLPGPRSTDLRVDGPIVGSGFDLYAAGTFAGASTYTGRTIATLGRPVTFRDAGSALNSSAYDVASTLVLYNAITASGDRLNDAAPVRLFAGQLSLVGTAGLPVTERIGSLELMSGASFLTLGPGASIRAGALTQHPGSTLTVSPSGGTILFDTPPTLIGGTSGTSRGVIPFAIAPFPGDEFSLTTYDATGGLCALDPVNEFDQQLPTSPTSPAPNVRIPQAASATASATVNSLIVDQSLALQNGATLTVSSGAIRLRGHITGDGSIYSPSDLYVYTDNASSASIDVPLRAPSVTFYGDARLSRPNDVGAVYVAGDLLLSDPRALGSGPVRVAGGLRFQGNSSYTVFNDISLGPLYRPLDTPPAQYGFTDYRISIPFNQTITLAGHLAGDAEGYAVLGTGTLRLDGDVTFASLFLDSPHVTLEVNGTISSDHPEPAARAAAILISGKVRGNGTILGTVWSGELSPGPDGAPGRLTVADLYSNIGSGLAVSVDLAGLTPGQDYDQLIVLHSFPYQVAEYPTLAANLTFSPPLGTEFLIVDFRGAPVVAPHFQSLPEGATLLASNGTPLRISYLAGDGDDVSLTVIPEPATLSPLILLAPAIATRRHRRRSRPLVIDH